jgi:hypothetical protein|tara:strand:+ start:26 stop:487 length:462 start_codon:yes stop_codon:yes gene_type:complete
MKLQVLRFSSEADSTNGLLLDVTNGTKFLAYTLEDEYRDIKKRTETRIPAGTYNIKLRNEGGFNQKYTKKYPSIHRGMLHIIDVPNFEYILIHVGNTDEHTAGCLLVGDTQENNQTKKDGFIGKSGNAYKRIYPSIAEAIENKGVTIEYIDLD